MTDFSLQKLAKICRTSSQKELALLAIGYETKMISTGHDFSAELHTIFSSTSRSSNSEFQFHWNMYKKLCVLMQRTNTQLAEIMICSERLNMSHLLANIVPVQESKSDSEDITESINRLVDAINLRIQNISNIRYIVTTIENQYFEHHMFISNHPVWTDIYTAINSVFEKHNKKFVSNRVSLTGSIYKYIDSECKPDTKYSDREISKMLETARPEYGGFHLI